jgi:hypothetical protein
MLRYEEEKLLDRVTVLASESTRLPRSAVGAYRREQIEWELMQLYRRLADVAEHEQRLHVLAQMWHAVETYVEDAVVRERIKQSWLTIKS